MRRSLFSVLSGNRTGGCDSGVRFGGTAMDQRYKIMIVDDDLKNLEALRLIMEDRYNIETVDSGEKAMDLLVKFRPDLVLLDINMSGIDGYEVCRRIRADKKYCFTKIILVSGKSMIDERLEGYKVGADDYITKPYEAGELDAKVRVFLRLKRSEEIDQVKEDLLKLISHETRTPLGAILGPAQIMMDDKSLDEDQQEYVQMIYKNGKRLLEFVEKTVFLCELKSGLRIQTSFDMVGAHLKDVAEKLSHVAEEKNIRVKLDIQDDTELKANWRQVDRVLTYLMDNAIKYSAKGGEVRANTEMTEDACIVRISDDGVGIKPEWKDKIFDEFAIEDVMHHQKGQGISLAISKYVLEHHDGSISVDSEVGKGATFTLRFPAKRGAVQASETPGISGEKER